MTKKMFAMEAGSARINVKNLRILVTWAIRTREKKTGPEDAISSAIFGSV